MQTHFPVSRSGMRGEGERIYEISSICVILAWRELCIYVSGLIYSRLRVRASAGDADGRGKYLVKVALPVFGFGRQLRTRSPGGPVGNYFVNRTARSANLGFTPVSAKVSWRATSSGNKAAIRPPRGNK